MNITVTEDHACSFTQLFTLRLMRLALCGIGIAFLGGCSQFGSHRLDCETPDDLELVVNTEPPIPETHHAYVDIPIEPGDLTTDTPDIGRWHLTLDEAIAVALRKNKEIIVNHHIPPEVRHGITMADAEFDPLFQAGGGWQRAQSQVTNVVEGPGGSVAATVNDFFGPPRGLADQLRISKKTRLGGEIAANFGSTYSFTEPGGAFLRFNPIIRSTLSFHAEQPFFRGSGREVNSINVRVARQMHHASIHQLEIVIRKTVFDTATAYWLLYGAVADLVSLDKSVHEARETWEKEKEKRGLGESSNPEVAEAREQLERFKANRILARKAAADAERELRDAMGLPHENGSRIVPVTLPRDFEPDLDWESAVVNAMHVRPELELRASMLNAARLNLDQACDALRPDLRGYVGYAITGADDKFDRSVSVIADNDFTTWWAGFIYEKQVLRRRDRANKQKAELAVSREIKSLDLARQQVYSELHEAHQAVASAWEVIQRQRDRREAATELLEARRAMFSVGEISLDQYLRATAAWSISMSEERKSVARYNSALARWEFANGDILDAYHVVLESFDPENSDKEADGAFLNEYLTPPASRQDEGMEVPPDPDTSEDVPAVPQNARESPRSNQRRRDSRVSLRSRVRCRLASPILSHCSSSNIA